MNILKNNFTVMGLVENFLEETDYKIKPIDREIEVEDMLEVDKETGKVINYGSINDIINTEEFKQWFKLKLEEEGAGKRWNK